MAGRLPFDPAKPTRRVVIPSWSEHAVLVLSSPSGERIIIVEGPLDMVTKELAARRPRWAGLSISLPDRQVEPFSYGPDALADLVLVWTLNRDKPHPSRRKPNVQ
jgi:hypothetical protein